LNLDQWLHKLSPWLRHLGLASFMSMGGISLGFAVPRLARIRTVRQSA